MIVNGENVAEVENHKDEHQQKFLEEEEPTLQCEICERRSGACSSKQNNRYHHDSNQSTTSTTEDSTLVGSATSVASRLDYGQVNSSSHPLFWPGKDVRLYDRENQLNSLRKAYKRRKTAARNGLPEIVLITGQSGTGKSALAYSLRETVQGDGGFFIHGKFDQLRQPSRPFATLADAFQRLVQLIERRGDTDVEAIREEARTAVGPEAALLTETFPCLRELLDVKKKSAKQSDAISESGAISDQKQIALVFRRFIKAIASPDRPLVLFIDDLQWADTASLDLLRSLWKGSTATCTRTQEIQQQQDQNTDIPGLMLLFTARGHEIAFDSYLSKLLRIMEDNGTGTITEIQVGNLRKKALRDMLSDILGVPTQDCTSLAEIVYQRSNKGQIFHAMRYLEKLQEDGYLVHDEDSGVWSWNEEKITRITKEESSIDDLTNDSLAMLLEQKTKQMPPPTQDILKVASCLGGEFSLDILCKAANLPLLGGIDAFKVGCELGFVAFKSNKKSGYFIHDKFQEAAYAMIPDQLKPAFQLQVARNLGANLTQEEFESNLLLIVNLGIFGSEVIDADECRLKLSELCLTAGRKAARSSAFSTAVHYFETGIKMLKGNYWETHYQLSLELHTAASEMAYCMGNHQKIDVFSFEIDRNALCLNDKLAAKSTQIMSMFSMERYEEALQLGFGVSKDLGEKFPSKVGTFGLFMDFMKTKRVLKGKTDADILSLLPMTDTGAIAVMSIIHLLYGLLVRSKFELAPLIGFRMVRLTMRYGLSPISSFGFGVYASINGRMGMVEEATRYGHLALQILERLPSSVASRTLCSVWADAMPHKIAYRKCLEPIIESHRLGMLTGDIETALIAAFVHSAVTFYVGEPLEKVLNLVTRYSVISRDYQNNAVKDFLNVLGQGCANFQGHAAHKPVFLTGMYMQEEEMITKTSAEKLACGFLWIFVMKYMLAAYMHDFEYADSFSSQIRKHIHVSVIPLIKTVHIFLEGFVAAARGTKARRYRSIARSRLKELRAAAKNCPENLNNKVCLLEAEIARFSYKHEKALQKYDQAVRLASKDGCLHEQGLASERAGRMLLKMGQLRKGHEYLQAARGYYAQWGAQIKTEQMDHILYKKSVD